MSSPATNTQSRPAIHYRNTDYTTGGGLPVYPQVIPNRGGHGPSVFRGYRDRCHPRPQPCHPCRPATMSDRIQSITNTWQKLQNKFSDLFSGASSKQEIRQTKREAKAELRERFRSGEISRKEYRALKKQLRQAKREAKKNL